MNNNNFKSIIYLFYICIILIGGFLFPIKIHGESMLGLISLAICIFGIAKFFNYFFNDKPVNIFIKVSFLNIVGIIFRVILEFGENSLYTNLTFINILNYIVILPIIISFLYYIICKYDYN